MLGKGSSVKLQKTIDELRVLHDRMRADSVRIGVLLKQASEIGYSNKIMGYLNDLHYTEDTSVRKEADKYLQSQMYQEKPETVIPGMKPPSRMPG